MNKKTYFQNVNDNVSALMKKQQRKDFSTYMRLYFIARERYIPRGKAYGRMVVIEATSHWNNLNK